MGIFGLLPCGSIRDTKAEDSKPRNFYQHNYAVAPRYEGAGRIAGKPGPPIQPGPRVPVPPVAQKQTSSLPQPQVETKKPVVSLFVNSLDRSHFGRVIEEAIRLHDAKRAVVVGIFHIGDYEAVTPEIEQELRRRGIAVHQVNSVFRELFAESSPTWVVSTPQGRHVAEGFLEITPFFDEWGEFDPKRSEEPEENSKVEGF